MKNLVLDEKTSGPVTLVYLNGRLDAIESPGLEEHLLELVKQGKKQLVLDLGQVSFIASTGLRMLLILSKRAKQLSGDVVLANLSETIRKTFLISGVLPNIRICETVDQAFKLMGV